MSVGSSSVVVVVVAGSQLVVSSSGVGVQVVVSSEVTSRLVSRDQVDLLVSRRLVGIVSLGVVVLLVSVVSGSLEVVGGVSIMLDLGLESVSVVLVVHHTTGAIGLHEGVVASHRVSIAFLLLLLDVARLVVMDGVRELVVGRGVVVLVMMLMMATVMEVVSSNSSRGGVDQEATVVGS